MRIEVKGRHTEVTDELRRQVEKRFGGVGRQVSSLATLEVELSEERNPSIADSQVAEATLHLKGVTLRAREASPEMLCTSAAPQRSATYTARNPRTRKAPFCMAGERECATGSPRTAKTRVEPSITAPCRPHG